MPAPPCPRGDSFESAGGTGWISACERSDRLGQPEDSTRAAAGNIARPGDHHFRRGAFIGVGGHRGILFIAISPAGDSLLAENRIRRNRTGGAYNLSEQVAQRGGEEGRVLIRARTNTLPL